MATRVPTGKPRGRPKGCQKSGGRVAKSLDKNERIKITSAMAGSILSVFERLGGEDFLYRWAKENQTAYVTNCLVRLMPPMPKDGDADFVQNNLQFNLDSNPKEAARRVAFMLASAVHDDPSLVIDVTPMETVEPSQAYINPNQWTPPIDAPDMPEPVDDPDRAKWAEGLGLSADEKLVRDTHVETLKSYAGSPAEQGLGPTRSPTSAAQDPRAAARDRMLQHRRKDLL